MGVILEYRTVKNEIGLIDYGGNFISTHVQQLKLLFFGNVGSKILSIKN